MSSEVPYSFEAESAVLGAIILKSPVINEVATILRGPADFFLPKHASVYAAQIEVYHEIQDIDMVTLTQKLSDKGELAQVGGVEYLIDLFNSVPSVTGVSHYAKIVRDKAVIRDLIEVTGKLSARAHAGDAAEDLLVEMGKGLYRLQQDKGLQSSSSLTDLMDAALELLVENDGKDTSGLCTGFADLDSKTGGLHPG